MKSAIRGLLFGLLLGSVTTVSGDQSIPTITVGQAANCQIGWDQNAPNLAEAQSYRYDVVTNGTAPIQTPATCSGTANPFLCKIPLPQAGKVVGTHNITVQSYLADGTPGGISATFTYKVTGNPPLAPANLRLIIGGSEPVN